MRRFSYPARARHGCQTQKERRRAWISSPNRALELVARRLPLPDDGPILRTHGQKAYVMRSIGAADLRRVHQSVRSRGMDPKGGHAPRFAPQHGNGFIRPGTKEFRRSCSILRRSWQKADMAQRYSQDCPPGSRQPATRRGGFTMLGDVPRPNRAHRSARAAQ